VKTEDGKMENGKMEEGKTEEMIKIADWTGRQICEGKVAFLPQEDPEMAPA